MYNRKKFSTVRYDRIGHPIETKVYFNLNLSPPFKEFENVCRKLKKEGNVIEVITHFINIMCLI